MNFSEYTNKNVNDVIAALKTNENGLSKKEAALRQKTSGLNEIRYKNVSAWQVFLRQLKSPFSYLLLAAAAVAILIGEKTDSIAIITFIFLNVAI